MSSGATPALVAPLVDNRVENMPPKTPYDHMSVQLPAMRLIAKTLGLFSSRVRESWRQVESQLESVQEMKINIALFSERYVPLGWANYDRMSSQVIAELANCDAEQGEQLLIQYHLDERTLQVLGYRFHAPQFQPWRAIYERAIERCKAEDWLSSVPLILVVIDGICTTSSGKHPFSGGADAQVFDTQTSGKGGLAEALKVLGATRRRLSEEPIDAPFRHGVVHGLNPNYGHPIVAAKALNLLQATTDYFVSIRDEAQRLARAEEEQRSISFREVAAEMRRTADLKAAVESWRPRPERTGLTIDESCAGLGDDTTPEAVAATYLQLLGKSNYGALAALHVDYPQRPLAYRAGQLRNELKGLRLLHWSISGIRDASAGMTTLSVDVQVEVSGHRDELSRELRMIYADQSFELMMRGTAGGRWYVMPNLTTDLWVKRLQLGAL
ncbi:hypothetical protein M4R22_05785 [Acidovorax sp. GBBC 3334]|uniref:hypothetical protein n=1 Tax=Acidovorax sp. GBBC 3334 TaxID=2940496 RepID=UPI0023041303|nr:hypothetical protein [Acidovorax sp. GBBC 3334]MDA8454266.1 hypothetical protein [Acidovorax sp. GBBC 3334]